MAAAALAHACAWVLPHADAVERVLTAYWVLATGAVVVTLSPLPVPAAFKDAVRLSAARGKLWSSRPASLGVISHLSVPQQWFAHFYALGAAVNAALLLALLAASGASAAGETWGEQTAVLSLVQVHLLRRFLETTRVMVYPRDARMHVIAYAFGMSYYAVVPLSLLQPLRGAVAAAATGARADEASPVVLAGGVARAARALASAPPVVVAGAAVFLAGNLLQCWAHAALAQLSAAAQRRPRQHIRTSGGTSGSGVGVGGSYAIPRGAPFFVSCPHYLGEIVVYLGLAMLCRGRVHSMLMLAWVVVNLVLAAAATQRWYHDVFPSYPKRRKALVPWVW